MLQEVIIVAKYDNRFIESCLASLGGKYPVIVMDTSDGGHPSWAYIRAFREYPAENYLFIQDSMESLVDDPITPFKDKMPDMGAVAWGHFHYGYDNDAQKDWVESQYGTDHPQFGIFGPVFYTNRKTLEHLDKEGLFPLKPKDKLEAQGTERAWADVFYKAQLPVESFGYWDKSRMERGDYPVFRKTWGARQ